MASYWDRTPLRVLTHVCHRATLRLAGQGMHIAQRCAVCGPSVVVGRWDVRAHTYLPYFCCTTSSIRWATV